jgi:hypothetical protein
MKPKEKAKELTLKFMKIDSDSEKFDEFKMKFFYAQRCALIAVDEMILVLPFTDTNATLNEYAIHLQKYLEQVKQEIQAL